MRIDRPFPVPSARSKRRALSRDVDAAVLTDVLADAYGDRPVVFGAQGTAWPGGVRDGYTYLDLQRYAARIAGAFREAGLEPGDAVAICTGNRPELLITALGALRAGLVAVPLNATSRETEIASAVKRADAKALVVDEDTADRALDTGVERVLRLETLPEDGPEVPAAKVDPSDPAVVFFTSGTTGEPKAATISHRALGSVLGRYARIARLLPTPRRHLVLLVMPLAHTAGLVTFLTTSVLGAPSLVDRRFDARRVLETIEEARPTVFAGSPAMYRMLIDAGAEGYDLSSIRIWGGGADVFHRDLLDGLRELGGFRVAGIPLKPLTIIGYGSSETTGPVTISPPVPIGERCIGWMLPGYEHRIVDEEDEDVPRGRVGELLLRGRGMMSGYREDAERRPARTWFRTGDLVRAGRFGLFYYEGRHKDVITSGGYTIAAREIEQVLDEHPSVDHTAAIGLPDRVKGERPVAVVVLRRDAPLVSPDDLHAWADARLAPYKRPRDIYVADEIPLTATQKAKKAELRERLIGGTLSQDA